MKNKHSTGWTSADELLYLEERKSICESCDPGHDVTTKWLESTNCQEIVITAFKTHGIPPHVIYREFEEELSRLQQAPEIVAQLMEQSA